MESERAEFHVPGVAVGAVVDGEVVLAEGFGQRDIEADLPVTATTLFAFGSSTKSLTALLVAMYVEDGLLEWETPVRDCIPGFRMHDAVATDQLTVRDLLCHNSGLPRHDFAWITNQTQSRAELVSRLEHLPSSGPFRRSWNYNNLMYTTAGYLIELVGGKTWEDALRQRVLDPLGMTTATFHVDQSRRTGDYARGYRRQAEEVVELPMRAMGVAGPAGSLNVSLQDALRWLQFNLDPEQALVPASVLQNVRNNHMHMPMPGQNDPASGWDELFPVGYGLGWYIRSYRGLRVLYHGGNIDGFSAMTSMAPSRRCGIVVLTNLNNTPLNNLLPYRLYDHVVGLDPIPWSTRLRNLRESQPPEEKAEHEEQEEGSERSGSGPQESGSAGAGAGRPLEDYVGTYRHPGYGQVSVRLSAAGNELECSLNDIDFALAPAGYEMFTTAPITPLPPGYGVFTVIFSTAVSGDVGSLSMTLEPSVPPTVFAR